MTTSIPVTEFPQVEVTVFTSDAVTSDPVPFARVIYEAEDGTPIDAGTTDINGLTLLESPFHQGQLFHVSAFKDVGTKGMTLTLRL